MSKPKILSTTTIASNKARWAVFLAAMLTIYYHLPLPFFLLMLFLAYLICSYCWTMASLRFTEGKCRGLEKRIFTGESFKLAYKLENQGYFPLVRCGLLLQIPQQFGVTTGNGLPVSSVFTGGEILDPPANEVYPSWNTYTFSYAWLKEKDEIEISLALEARLRGIYYFPAVQFFVGDPSGLYRGLKLISQDQYLYVLPRLKGTEDIQKIIVFEENNREDIFGLEDRYQVQGVRDYQQSDSPKSINWYATARGGSLKTNLYQRTSSEYCLVVLDLSVGNCPQYEFNCIRYEDPALEEAVSMAAGIALYHLEQGAMTAFYTNAPLLQWQKRDIPISDRPLHYMAKVKKITTLDFAQGEIQGQKILELCAGIDETSRASSNGQNKLWEKIQEAPANTTIFIIGYHNPPESWSKMLDYDGDSARLQAEGFYTRQRLGALSSSKVRLFNLTRGGVPR